jgi:surface protein
MPPNLPSTTLGKRKKNMVYQPKIKKVVHPGGGYTLVALPGSKIGDTEVIDGELCTIRSRESLMWLIKDSTSSRTSHSSRNHQNAQWRIEEAVTRTCTSYITNMQGIFTYKAINHDLQFHYDTRRVENMKDMFRGTIFKGGATIPNVRSLRHWDTSKCSDMSHMFAYSNFNGSISAWNTRNVRTMKSMFSDNRTFNQSISGWDTRNVINMEEMFYKATRFNRPLTYWVVSKVTNMDRMFAGATHFNQNLSSWNPRRIQTSKDMFRGATSYSPTKPKDAFHTKIGFNPLSTKFKQPKPKKYKARGDMITQWTTLQGFQAVQAVRRRNSTMRDHQDPETYREARRINRAISQYMRNSGLRTPITPEGLHPTYLFRAIHSEPAARLLKTGKLNDPGFMAFSRSKYQAGLNRVDSNKGGLIVRIDVRALPRGIPWVWFSSYNSTSDESLKSRWGTLYPIPRSSAPHEQEVLLPPGKLVLGNILYNGSFPKTYEAVYVPNTKAKSLEQKPIIRRLGPPLLDSRTRQTQTNRDLARMFHQVMNRKA